MRQLTLTLLFFVLGLSASAQEPITIGPKISTDSKGWDFGTVEQGTRDKKVIKVKNTGGKVLRITDIKVTCGCVQATMPQKEIPPGETRDLVLTLSTYRSHGRIRKHCYLYSNAAGAKGPYILTIDGEIMADWIVDKRQIQFGRLEAGQDYKQKFKVVSRNGRHLELLSISSRHPNVKIEHRITKGDEKKALEFEVTVTLKETQAPGPFADAIAVRVKGRPTPLQNVMLYARLKGGASVYPPKVFMGRIFFDQQARRVLKLTLEEGYSIMGVKPSKENSMKVEIEPAPDGVSYEIVIYVTGLASQANMDESIEISTDNPLHSKIVVPVSWVSRPQKTR